MPSKKYNDEFCRKASLLHKQGLTWVTVAQKMGVESHIIQRTTTRWEEKQRESISKGR